jgi:ribonuclease BN (tRNA processing enzyme)
VAGGNISTGPASPPILSAPSPFATRLLLLGTAGGPTYWPNTNRRSTSFALVVGDAVYLVDCGDGVGKRLQEALELPNQRETMKTLRALFLTHLHSDHVVDFPNILLERGTRIVIGLPWRLPGNSQRSAMGAAAS